MNVNGILCAGCSWPLPSALWESSGERTCPSCGVALYVRVFPAFASKPAAPETQKVVEGGEASCFYHAQNRAVVPCGECGRFLCSLCSLEIPGGVLCPTCFQAGVSTHKNQVLETSRTMHDTIALALATVPLLLIWPVVVTAPLALYWTVRHWKSPRSIVPRSRVRYYFAILFALGGLALAGLLIVAIVISSRRRS